MGGRPALPLALGSGIGADLRRLPSALPRFDAFSRSLQNSQNAVARRFGVMQFRPADQARWSAGAVVQAILTGCTWPSPYTGRNWLLGLIAAGIHCAHVSLQLSA